MLRLAPLLRDLGELSWDDYYLTEKTRIEADDEAVPRELPRSAVPPRLLCMLGPLQRPCPMLPQQQQ